MTGNRDIVLELVANTMSMSMKTNQALDYLEGHGVSMSERTLRRKKNKVYSSKKNAVWLNEHTKEGFTKNHRQIMDRLQFQIDTLTNMFTNESLKDKEIEFLGLKFPQGKKNPQLMIQLSKRIQELLELYSKLNLGTPVISQMVAQLNPSFNKEMTEEDLKKGWMII